MLGVLRPMHKHPKANTPRVSGVYVLELACSILEKETALLSMPAFKDYLWFSRQYNAWHAIAVMAAELSVHSQGPVADRAWAVLDSSLEFNKASVADSEKGRLWRPIEKLLKRAREKRLETLQHHPSCPSGLASFVTDQPTAEDPGRPFPQSATKAPPPPQTANAAMAFTPYIGPPPDGTTLGLSPAEIEATKTGEWQLPSDFMNIDMNFESFNNGGDSGKISDSPDNAWQSWNYFTEGLQQPEDPLFPMQTDPSQGNVVNVTPYQSDSPFGWQAMALGPAQGGGL